MGQEEKDISMTIEELYLRKLAGQDKWLDIAPRMADLRRYAGQCESVIEFGCRTGNSTTAFLAGGARVHSYDLNPPEFECPGDVANRWTWEIADTAALTDMPDCDLLFVDTIHTTAQVNAEIRMADRARQFLIFHDVKEWGWRGEDGGAGILPAIFNFLARNKRWTVHEILDDDQWGLLVLRRIGR
jgi:hypothetical protein